MVDCAVSPWRVMSGLSSLIPSTGRSFKRCGLVGVGPLNEQNWCLGGLQTPSAWVSGRGTPCPLHRHAPSQKSPIMADLLTMKFAPFLACSLLTYIGGALSGDSRKSKRRRRLVMNTVTTCKGATATKPVAKRAETFPRTAPPRGIVCSVSAVLNGGSGTEPAS
jgi:hypothetical protein